jgi:hypothetical protein
MLDNGALMPLALGTQVRVTHGQLRALDGPFTEAKEIIGGYAIFELYGKKDAWAVAKEFTPLHKHFFPGQDGTCERRTFASRGPQRRGRADAVGGRDGRRHRLRDPSPLAARVAPPDHPLGADAARRPVAEELTQEALPRHRTAARDGPPEKARRVTLDHSRRCRMTEHRHGRIVMDMDKGTGNPAGDPVPLRRYLGLRPVRPNTIVGRSTEL